MKKPLDLETATIDTIFNRVSAIGKTLDKGIIMELPIN